MNLNNIQIISIAECIADLSEILEWHEKEWGQDWANQIKTATNLNKIPTIFVARHQNKPVGTVLLIDYDLPDRKDLYPWMGGVYVKPEFRGIGIGKLLVIHALQLARRMSLKELWLYTSNQVNFYQTLGWAPYETCTFNDNQIQIMRIDLTT